MLAEPELFADLSERGGGEALRAKHLAAAERIEATRGLSQSALRAEPFSSFGLRGVATVSVFIVIRSWTGQPV